MRGRHPESLVESDTVKREDTIDSLLAALEVAEQAASKGPWHAVIVGPEHADIRLEPRGHLALLAWGMNTAADARFIALERNAVPKLIAALRERRDEAQT